MPYVVRLPGPNLAILTGGQFGFGANGTGTVSYDLFRVTQYPDPGLSLAPVLDRLASSSVLWTANTPVGTSLTVKTSLDGINFSTATNGAAITGLNGQTDPTVDIFSVDSSANYTNTHKSGGSNATVTYDIANRRVTLAGGSGSLYLFTSITAGDVDILCDMDRSDAGGLVWHFVDASNYYELGCYDDSASGGFTSTLRLYKVASGTRTLLGSASTVVWHRATSGSSPYKRFRVTMLGAVITISFDGQVVQTFTDGSPLASGQVGLRNDGGTSRYYQLRIQPRGDYVSGTPAGDTITADHVYTQVTMTTTDPAQQPQLLDLTTSARSPSIAQGVLIPQLHDPTTPFSAFLNAEMDSIASASGDFTWNIDKTGALSFMGRQASPAPFVLYADTDFLRDPSVTPSSIADLYRTRQVVTNCIDITSLQTETKIADGTATSWQMAYPLYSAPAISINSTVQSVGIQGVDTGKTFYWQAGNNAIGQDSASAKIAAGTGIKFQYIGQFPKTVVADNLTEQIARALVEIGTTGIIENIVDGKGMLASNALVMANGLLSRYGNNSAVQAVATTRRSGLASGMIIPVFIPAQGLINRQLLLTQIQTSTQMQSDGTVLYEYQLTGTEGANLQNWLLVFKSFSL